MGVVESIGLHDERRPRFARVCTTCRDYHDLASRHFQPRTSATDWMNASVSASASCRLASSD